MEKNKLYFRSADVKAEGDNESRTISGYAVVFDKWSRDLGGFKEIVRKTAITDELVKSSDIVMCVNHDTDKMLARSRNGEGTLQLELRDEGLFFMFDAPTTTLGDETLFNVRNGNLFECSFCFSIPENGDVWSRDSDGNLSREIVAIDGLYDCSIVTHAAYPDTSVSAKRYAEVKATAEEVDKAMDAVDAEFDNL